MGSRLAENFRPLLPLVRGQRRGILLGAVSLAGATAFTFVAPWLMKAAVDGLAGPPRPRALAAYCALIVGAAVLQGVCRFGMRWWLVGVSREVEYGLRNLVFRRLLELPLRFHQAHRTGDLMSRATGDVEAVRMAVGPGLMQLANTVLSLLAALGMMLALSPGLAAWSLLPVPAVAAVMYLSAQSYHRRFLAVQAQAARVNAAAQESFSGVRVVKTYALEGRQREAFLRENLLAQARAMDLARTMAFFHPLVGAIAGAGVLAVLWAGGRRVAAGEITLGTLVAFMALVGLLTWPTIALGWVISLFQRGSAAMERINGILLAPEAPDDPPGALPLPAAPGGMAVEARGLTFAYPGRDEPVLRDCSFRVDPGEVVALVGRTGAGKSTLLQLLPRLWPVPGGALLVDGHDVARMRAADLRGAIGFVPQETFLFSETIEENVALPEGGVDEALAARVREAAALAGLAPDVEGFPAGYATVVGERGVTLSGGQRQRTAIARALLRRPRLLVLDDAFSSVDTETEERILGGVLRGRGERTVILVSHRLSTVRRADRILVLEGGRIAEAGTHDELMALGGAYRGIVERQLLAEELEREAP